MYVVSKNKRIVTLVNTNKRSWSNGFVVEIKYISTLYTQQYNNKKGRDKGDCVLEHPVLLVV